MLKTVVYIDGFNLYYGMLRYSAWKWLDVVKLFTDHVLIDGAEVTEVRYYTAPVLGRMSDDPQSPIRQRLYLQALRKLYPLRLVIVEGQMLAGKVHQRLVEPIPSAPHLKTVQVYSFVEKKTDVSLATDMLNGAWRGDYEQAVLCNNDSDLQRRW
jgi:NYN domain